MPTRLRRRLSTLALPAIAVACAAVVLVALPARGASEPTHAAKTPRTTIAKHKPRHRHKPKHKHKRHERKHRVHKPSLGQRAARIALKAVGVPYRWGGASPASGFDCSGLVHWAYARLGINLPHSSYALYGRGHSVRRSGMKPGDLVFFSGLGHVGVYIGRGRMVHAPHSGSTVQVVTLRGPYYGSRLVGARRIA